MTAVIKKVNDFWDIRDKFREKKQPIPVRNWYIICSYFPKDVEGEIVKGDTVVYKGIEYIVVDGPIDTGSHEDCIHPSSIALIEKE